MTTQFQLWACWLQSNRQGLFSSPLHWRELQGRNISKQLGKLCWEDLWQLRERSVCEFIGEDHWSLDKEWLGFCPAESFFEHNKWSWHSLAEGHSAQYTWAKSRYASGCQTGLQSWIIHHHCHCQYYHAQVSMEPSILGALLVAVGSVLALAATLYLRQDHHHHLSI